MAVENKYVTHNATSEAVSEGPAALFSGAVVRRIPFSFEVAAADSDGSIYRIAALSPMAIVTGIKLISDAIANATDYDIGVYKPLSLDGSVIDKDCFLDGADINAGKAVLTEMLVPAPENFGKRIYEIAGLTDYQKYGTVDLAITANTVGTAAGTLAGYVEVVDAV